MTTKRNNTTHNEVVVERVLTSDAFLTREIKKAPMKTTGDSLIADLTHLPNDLKITIQGAREHNLKNVDLEFPRNRMVVFTGLSGSGKSSLAFDTLFAEGPRRYVESLRRTRGFDRPEDHEPQSAFDGRHNHRDL